MNNIETLEQIIKYFERNEVVFDKKYKEAIENLIKENKELKEKNEELIELSTKVSKDVTDKIWKDKIEYIIENTVSSYDCLIEKLYILLYGENVIKGE